MNLTSKISSIWFGDKERAMASAIGLSGVPIGSFLSFVIPQFIIKESDYNNLVLAKEHFLMYLLIQTMIVTILCIPALAFMREEPPSPPSVVANETNNAHTFCEGLSMLARNWNYIKIFSIYLFVAGINNSFGSIYANLAAKFNYSLFVISLGCVFSISGGVFFTFLVGFLLDKYQNYKRLQIYITGMAIVANVYHTFSLPNGNPYLELIAMFLSGSSTIAICAVTFPFAVEATFPV
jgi:Na+/melibiose symporter-like transporter